MRSIRLVTMLLCCACGGSDNAKVPSAPGSPQTDAGSEPSNDGGKGGSRSVAGQGGGGGRGGGGQSGQAGGGGAGGAGPTAMQGPIVTLLSPTAANDPNKDEVEIGPTVVVRCRAERRSGEGVGAVNKAAVKIAMRSPTEPEVWTEAPVNALPDDEYEAKFDVFKLPNGSLRFRCVAEDLARPANQTTAMVDTFLDQGPSIEIRSPDKMYYALRTPVPIEFKVQANALSATDTEAEVDTSSIKLTVAGVEHAFEGSAMMPGVYHTSVDFDDRMVYPVPPQSAQITVSASNRRSPKVATRAEKVDIAIDGEGPSIVVKAPIDGDILPQGETALEVEVTDPAGVESSSLVADFNHGLLVIRKWEGTGPLFWQRFDTRDFGTQLTRLTIDITAKDSVGNERTVVHTLKLDTLPPVISLDPPLIREWRKVNNSLYCSALFDPVGPDAPNDTETITSFGYFRALVEDRTNTPVTGPNDPAPIVYLAGVEQTKVELFIQRKPTVPLLLDTDGDTYCDEINYDALAPEEQPFRQKLRPTNPGGLPWYKLLDAMDDTAPNSNPVLDNAACFAPSAGGTFTQVLPPEPFCRNGGSGLTTLSRVVPGRSQDRPPALYAVDPSNNTADAACAGNYWELVIIARVGWNCLAARAYDKKGNRGVSEPLRVCFSDSPMTPSNCTVEEMPSCTSSCTFADGQRYHHTEGYVQWYFP